ncbi:MAG: S-layer homology domain-containing protein [Gudongella sp.]|nr:S-layer homology domain-containing protein [Gudongella sp.]
MKIHKFNILILVMLLLISSTAFASMEDKLIGHWAKDTINKEFLSYYFPYFARDEFNEFYPNKAIARDRFGLSTASIFKVKGYTVLGMENPGELTRKEMLRIVGSRLEEIGLVTDPNYSLDFADITGLSEEFIDYLKILNKEGIVLGDGGSSFSPDRKLTQAEAVVVLQRLESLLNRINRISFVTKGVENSYNNREELVTMINENNVVLSITKQFPTPGYSLLVKEILKHGDMFKVYLQIEKPSTDSMQLQVITFKTITIDIDKTELGDGPYNFVVEGFVD